MPRDIRDICRKTRSAIMDIFDFTDIGTREDALRMLADKNPALAKHADTCRACGQTIDAHLNCEEVYASLPA